MTELFLSNQMVNVSAPDHPKEEPYYGEKKQLQWISAAGQMGEEGQ